MRDLITKNSASLVLPNTTKNLILNVLRDEWKIVHDIDPLLMDRFVKFVSINTIKKMENVSNMTKYLIVLITVI